jgi:NADH-ubiquinone oxidoreductase chain 5
MSTVLSNRVGDFFLFVSFSYYIFGGVAINIYFLFFGFPLFIFLASLTKSAQFPFMGWLPKAIRAPTPVRSLVHRRTLVTAGVFLIFKFYGLLSVNIIIFVLFMISLVTVFYASLISIFEKDIKKVVALSTLSQIGFCVIAISLGLVFIGYLHLINHAFIKRCLFISLGFYIYYKLGNQDTRGLSFLQVSYKVVQFQFIRCLFRICGVLFSGGLITKDYVLEFLFMNNYSFIVVLLIFFVV